MTAPTTTRGKIRYDRALDPAVFVTWAQVNSDASLAKYVRGRMDAAQEKQLAVRLALDEILGVKVAWVASQSHEGQEYRVILVGDRFLCNCPAMFDPATLHYDRRVTCIHAQTVKLRTRCRPNVY